jgi:hypothetical protein
MQDPNPAKSQDLED